MSNTIWKCNAFISQLSCLWSKLYDILFITLIFLHCFLIVLINHFFIKDNLKCYVSALSKQTNTFPPFIVPYCYKISIKPLYQQKFSEKLHIKVQYLSKLIQYLSQFKDCSNQQICFSLKRTWVYPVPWWWQEKNWRSGKSSLSWSSTFTSSGKKTL